MLVIPAIELKDGLCVHTEHRQMEDEVCFEDPLAVVERLVAAGAKALHVVDVNSSLSGSPENAHVVELIARAWPRLEIEVAGGIRQEDQISLYLHSGARYVVLSPKLARDLARVGELASDYPSQLLAAVDARDGRCSHGDPVDIALHLAEEGVVGVLYTDIASLGPVNGAQLEATMRLAEQAPVPVTGNGLLHSLEDARALRQRAPKGLRGVLLGRASLDSIDLAELIKETGAGRRGKNHVG
ncbi:MAG: 1-(5-phosphoribosyl)-5-((5-phosphoribosylamino)methylideneamino)imidazole-4-carboxamide isomerase [Gammaproteobacteria bacterium]|nr:1-(5-phosphoribosyl)-5-((5-phosphoribosylamino)methylideneamino)imidazole-4-carboxamide isomerase [Gammaproteobacteria bacterium]